MLLTGLPIGTTRPVAPRSHSQWLTSIEASVGPYKLLTRTPGSTRSASRTPGSLRVPFAALDSLVDQLAEMVILRNRLRELVHHGRQQALVGAGNRGNWEEVERAEQAVARGLQQLQERIMELRMVPLRTLFPPLRRIAHDEGARWGKQVELEIQGGDTPMDKALLELANEALGHLVRNAVIHGIETPAERSREIAAATLIG